MIGIFQDGFLKYSHFTCFNLSRYASNSRNITTGVSIHIGLVFLISKALLICVYNRFPNFLIQSSIDNDTVNIPNIEHAIISYDQQLERTLNVQSLLKLNCLPPNNVFVISYLLYKILSYSYKKKWIYNFLLSLFNFLRLVFIVLTKIHLSRLIKTGIFRSWHQILKEEISQKWNFKSMHCVWDTQ